MSDDELEKLAAEMQNIQPSADSRKQGMAAAMAAFDLEFASETAETTVKSEENIEAAQGLTDAPRPTGQTTDNGSVQTFGSDMMAKINTLFTFKPRTMMLAGSCMAALFAGMVIMPNLSDVSIEDQLAKSTPSTVSTTDMAADRAAMETPSATAPVKPLSEVKEPSVTVPAPTVERGGINIADTSTQSDPAAEAMVTIERAVPAVTKVETRRRIKTPASTVERVVPAITKQVERRVENADGTFQIVKETVVVQPQSVDYVTVPPVYETYTESVVTQEATTERVTVPVIEANINTAKRQVEAAQVNNNQSAQPAPSVANPSLSRLGLYGGTPAPVTAQPIAPPVSSTPAPVTTLMAEAPAFKNPRLVNGYTLEAAPPEFETVTETIVVQEATTELVSVPATYETVTETVVAQEASTELVTIPGEYKWVEGDVEGGTTVQTTTPPKYETVTETVVVQEASTQLVAIPQSFETVKETLVLHPQYYAADGSLVPAVTQEVSRRIARTPARAHERVIPAVSKTVSRSVLISPASTVEHFIPYEKKDGKTRVVITPSKTMERLVPAVTKQVERRVIKTPTRTQEKVIPGVTKEVHVKKLVRPQTFYLRNEDGKIVREFASLDEFEHYKSNLPTPVTEKPVSTFSVDVDTASYSFLRASINSGKLPPRSSIRLEELINYFPYDYEAPKSADEPFKANVTVTPTPWNADTKLMHIGIKGYVPPADEKPRSNLVFLIDVSGSMKDAKKLPLLVNSFKLLLGTLDANDTVSIVTYAGSVRTALEPTRANEKDKIHDVLNSLSANGGTAGAAGLQLAYAKAEESFDEEGVNRVILATDGDFNIGFSSPDEMKSFIEEKRETGIFLSVLGFGMGNYKDNRMQALAQNGNGVAAYIDTLAEANKVLANEAGSALMTIAKDVKIQVEFNPDTIAEYRLIGYETRALKRQDFNNDKVDAGEIGAGHSVTAIYELTPVGSSAITNDPLRYVTERLEQTTGSDEFAFVKIRHKLPHADKSTLQTFPIGKGHERRLKQADDDMRFATAVAAVGQKLRGNAAVDGFSYQDAIKLAKRARGEDENGYRNEFIQLVRLIESLDK